MHSLLGITQIGMGLGAGLASALLFMVVKTGSMLALALYFVAPLPILIVALGWNHRSGLIAVFVGTIVVATVFGTNAGLVYGIGVALPSWFVAYLTTLVQHDDEVDYWYPLGNILLIICGLSAFLTLVGAMAIGGDYEGFIKAFSDAVESINKVDPEMLTPLGSTPEAVAARFAQIAPAISSAVGVLSSVTLLWIAAKIVKASGRLVRPWPDVAMTAMPRIAVGALISSVGLGFTMSGFPALFFRSLGAALSLAYALQGYAVVNVLTRGKKIRRPIMSSLVMTLIILPGWPVIALAALGITDAVASLRLRAFARANPLPPNPT